MRVQRVQRVVVVASAPLVISTVAEQSGEISSL